MNQVACVIVVVWIFWPVGPLVTCAYKPGRFHAPLQPALLKPLLPSPFPEVGQTMLHQLLSRLKSSLQLPECLRTMGYLRCGGVGFRIMFQGGDQEPGILHMNAMMYI